MHIYSNENNLKSYHFTYNKSTEIIKTIKFVENTIIILKSKFVLNLVFQFI